MSEKEEEQAQQLKAFVDGEPTEIASEDAEVVGLLRDVAGAPTADDATLHKTWERIRQEAPLRTGARWPLLGFAAAAAIVLLLLMWPAGTPPLPPGPSVAEHKAAMDALHPSFGPPLQRLAALHQVAGKERTRLVAELSQ